MYYIYGVCIYSPGEYYSCIYGIAYIHIQCDWFSTVFRNNVKNIVYLGIPAVDFLDIKIWCPQGYFFVCMLE